MKDYFEKLSVLMQLGQYDSKEELYFEMWLEELKAYGLVNIYGRCYESFELIPPVFIPCNRLKPTKSNPQRVVQHDYPLLRNWTYEFDYFVYFNDSACPKLFATLGSDNDYDVYKKAFFISQQDIWGTITRIDVKPDFMGRNNTTSVKFPLIQKTLFSNKNIYINKTQVPDIFKKTFTPERYLYQDENVTKKRKIRFETKTILEFVNTL